MIVTLLIWFYLCHSGLRPRVYILTLTAVRVHSPVFYMGKMVYIDFGSKFGISEIRTEHLWILSRMLYHYASRVDVEVEFVVRVYQSSCEGSDQ